MIFTISAFSQKNCLKSLFLASLLCLTWQNNTALAQGQPTECQQKNYRILQQVSFIENSRRNIAALSSPASIAPLLNVISGNNQHEQHLLNFLEAEKALYEIIEKHFIQPDAAYTKIKAYIRTEDAKALRSTNYNCLRNNHPNALEQQQKIAEHILQALDKNSREFGAPLQSRKDAKELQPSHIIAFIKTDRALEASTLNRLQAEVTAEEWAAERQERLRQGLDSRTATMLANAAPRCFPNQNRNRTQTTPAVFAPDFVQAFLPILRRPVGYDVSMAADAAVCQLGLQHPRQLANIDEIAYNFLQQADGITPPLREQATQWYLQKQRLDRAKMSLNMLNIQIRNLERQSTENDPNRGLLEQLKQRYQEATIQLDKEENALQQRKPREIRDFKETQERALSLRSMLFKNGYTRLATLNATTPAQHLQQIRTIEQRFGISLLEDKPTTNTPSAQISTYLDNKHAFTKFQMQQIQGFSNTIKENPSAIWSTDINQRECAVHTVMRQTLQELDRSCLSEQETSAIRQLIQQLKY